MPLKKKQIVAFIIPMTLCVLGVAGAQTGGIPPLDRPTAAVAAPRDIDVPPAQQRIAGNQALLRMQESSTRVRQALEQARAARDVVKTLCLSDKLNQIDVAVRSGKDRLASLSSAVDAGDKDRSRHELMIMLALRDRTDQLGREANQCIGEEAGFIGQSELSLQIDPNIPDNNVDQLGEDPEIISPPPELTSPTF